MTNKLNTVDLIDMMGARFEMVARMGSNQSDTVLFRTRMAPGRLVPLHSHIDPECFYLIDGRIEVFLVDDAPKWRVVDTGQSCLVADGIKHAVRNAADKTADIVLVTNNRFASFLSEAGRSAIPGAVFASPSPEDIQRLMRVSQAYGYWNASPAESAAITG
ncbi:MAG TPA: cupin domain-containing protein [Xanthobacteraceae bacterium]|jgi:quercetin dioxygenase-like cupin family protein